MSRFLRITLTLLGVSITMAGCNLISVQPSTRSQTRLNPSHTTANPTASFEGTLSCPKAGSVIKSFYDSNDAGNFTTSLKLLDPQVSLVTWAEGVNGRHWREVHLTGWEEILPALNQRGLRRNTGKPDSPIYHETEFKVSGDEVTFMLRPDRVSPEGRPYDPYRVTVQFIGCQIKALTVIEYFTQV